MKYLFIGAMGILLAGCVITDDGIGINQPNVPVNVCINAVSDVEAENFKNQIASEPFKDDRLTRGMMLGENRCFQASQVVTVMDGFTFDDNKLEIAKFLYTRTEDRQNYQIVIDALTFQSNKDELRNYILLVD